MNNIVPLLPGPIIGLYAPAFFPSLGTTALALIFNLTPLVLGGVKAAFMSASPSSDLPEVDRKKMFQYTVTAAVAQALATAGLFSGSELLEVASKGAHLVAAAGAGVATGLFFRNPETIELDDQEDTRALLGSEGEISPV